MAQPVPYNPTPALVSVAERQLILGQAVSWYTGSGWWIAARNDYVVTLVSQPRAGPNHILHLLLTFFTCGLWAPGWLLVAITHKSAVRQVTVSVDEYGQVATR